MIRLFLAGLLAVAFNFASAEEMVEFDREPAAVTKPGKRSYPGGQDEEDLRVLATVPDASLKTDSRSVQREVYRNLYNQELKEEHPETLEE
jgi:hypothetical protein